MDGTAGPLFSLTDAGFYSHVRDVVTIPFPGSITIDDGEWHYVGIKWDETGIWSLVVDNVVAGTFDMSSDFSDVDV